MNVKKARRPESEPVWRKNVGIRSINADEWRVKCLQKKLRSLRGLLPGDGLEKNTQLVGRTHGRVYQIHLPAPHPWRRQW